ncbi:MAG: hypothetical protein M3Y39_21095 [Chloroflexota bacterium]|nr:hypothetical protein [Chloroflexota bacterium]
MFFNDPLEGTETVENSSLAASIVPVLKNITTGRRFQRGLFPLFRFASAGRSADVYRTARINLALIGKDG